MTKHRKAIDLFCGAGGLTQGLKQAGFRVVGAIESHPTCAATYALNHSKTKLKEADITSVDPAAFMHELKLERGELDLLAGCPPCQGYSTIGTRNRGVKDDPRNELVFEIVRFAKVFLPKTIMMENVPALTSDKKMMDIMGELKSMGYSTDIKVLDLSEFRVPQIRKRMILVASRVGIIQIKRRKWGSKRKSTVRETISALPPVGTSGDKLHDIVENRSNLVVRRIAAIPKDGGSRDSLSGSLRLACHNKTSGFRDVYGRMSWDKPAPTITGGCNNPSKGRFIHPDENRAITLREAALLQTFPIDYQFSFASGREGVARMIGNALPPQFIEFHARAIKTHIKAVETGG
jgi:DNA (cytosine-5)-methyltransferase 1